MKTLGFAARALGEALFLGGGGARTAGQLGGLVAALAPRLALHAPVVLACEDRFAFTAALLAAWSRGCPVHLPANVRPETVAGVAVLARASVILHDQPGATGLDVRAIDGDVKDAPWPALALSANELAAVVYTSGSQGAPVAHGKTLGQLLGEAETLAACFALAGRTVLSSAPCHHIYGLLFGVLVPLIAGGRLSRATPLYPAEVVAAARELGAEVWVTVPPHLRAFADTDVAPLRTFARVFSSGGPVPPAVLAALVAGGVPLVQVFGSTETGGIGHRAGDEAAWRPLPGVRVGVAGENADLLTVESPWLPPAGPRPLVTQDRVRLAPLGDGAVSFVHVGRADTVVKVGGRRVDLGDLEARLRQIPGVDNARVVAVDTASAHGVELWAALESADSSLTPADVRRQLSRSLDAVSLPRRMRVVRALPTAVGSAGKVTREALLALFATPGSAPEKPSPSPMTFTIDPRPLPDGSFVYTPPATLGFFAGHFPGQPVLPAIVQLQRLALRLARRRWSDLGSLRGLSRVKFKKPIAPGDEIVVVLDRARPDLVKFELRVSGEPVSSGNLLFGALAAPGEPRGETP
jgi:acyl-CoA synthetase (AMP-forming)/AMP-acid ligase II